MAGNKNVYNDAIKKGASAAWDARWEDAIREYRRALDEFPDDASTHSALAQALQEANRFDEAVHEYLLTSKLQPNEPVPLARAAALLEKMGRRAEAATAQLALADIFAGLKVMNQAMDVWRRAAALEPDRIEPHRELAVAYRESGQNRAAATELVTLAKIAQRAGDFTSAQDYTGQALALDADNRAAKVLMAELTGRGLAAPADRAESPVEHARQSSLAQLAATLMDGRTLRRRVSPEAPKQSVSELETLLAKAIEAQSQGRVADAIAAYEQISAAGGASSELQFNLAVLYQQTSSHDAAIPLFEETARDPNFALASHDALGQSYWAQGKLDLALEHFTRALQSVDPENVQQDQADQVIRVFESLADGYRAKGDLARGDGFTRMLIQFLSSKGWEDKARQVQRRVQAIAESSTPSSFADVRAVPELEQVTDSLALSEQYLNQGKLFAASDAAYQAVALAPYYLPAHAQVAEISAKAGRVQQAREKYDMLAETAVARGDVPKAISFYREGLLLAPEDETRRAKLIELMVQSGELTKALSQFIEWGSELERAGERQKAIDQYAEGVRLAQRAGVGDKPAIELRTRLAELYVKTRDWHNALATFEELKRAAPEDERARFYLADLYLQTGQRERSERELDELLASYARSPQKTRAVLAALTQKWRDELWLNLRFARALAAVGETKKAVEHLDALGERLLNSGQREQAVIVIQEIIALGPEQVDDYRQLLETMLA